MYFHCTFSISIKLSVSCYQAIFYVIESSLDLFFDILRHFGKILKITRKVNMNFTASESIDVTMSLQCTSTKFYSLFSFCICLCLYFPFAFSSAFVETHGWTRDIAIQSLPQSALPLLPLMSWQENESLCAFRCDTSKAVALNCEVICLKARSGWYFKKFATSFAMWRVKQSLLANSQNSQNLHEKSQTLKVKWGKFYLQWHIQYAH